MKSQKLQAKILFNKENKKYRKIIFIYVSEHCESFEIPILWSLSRRQFCAQYICIPYPTLAYLFYVLDI